MSTTPKYTSRIGNLTITLNDEKSGECVSVPVGKYAHCTVAYLGDIPEDIEIIWKNLCKCFESSDSSSGKSDFHFETVRLAMFGPSANIEVVVLKLVSTKEFNDKLLAFYKTFGRPDNGFFEDEPVFHISMRNVDTDAANTIRKSVENGVALKIKAHHVDIKQLGPFDPVYTMTL